MAAHKSLATASRGLSQSIASKTACSRASARTYAPRTCSPTRTRCASLPLPTLSWAPTPCPPSSRTTRPGGCCSRRRTPGSSVAKRPSSWRASYPERSSSSGPSSAQGRLRHRRPASRGSRRGCRIRGTVGVFWFNYAARRNMDMDVVYWGALHKDSADGALNESTHAKIEAVVKIKTEQLRAYPEEKQNDSRFAKGP